MNTKRKINKSLTKSRAMSLLEKITGGPLTFSELLNSIRLSEELTHSAFASMLGISRSHLCDIEKGRKAVSLIRAIEFAEILGYSKDQFAELALQTQVDNAGLPYKVRLG